MTGQEFINQISSHLIMHAHNILNAKYPDAHTKNYVGLSDETVQIIIDECKRLQQNGISLTAIPIRGTLAHTPDIDPEQWLTEHTIVKLIAYDTTVYIDAICSQFTGIINDITDTYIGEKIPDWFYPSTRNPANSKNKVLQILNKIKITLKKNDTSTTYSLIEFCQHIIWGKISRWRLVEKIHTVIKKQRR